jgi:hypothetical protein
MCNLAASREGGRVGAPPARSQRLREPKWRSDRCSIAGTTRIRTCSTAAEAMPARAQRYQTGCGRRARAPRCHDAGHAARPDWFDVGRHRLVAATYPGLCSPSRREVSKTVNFCLPSALAAADIARRVAATLGTTASGARRRTARMNDMVCYGYVRAQNKALRSACVARHARCVATGAVSGRPAHRVRVRWRARQASVAHKVSTPRRPLQCTYTTLQPHEPRCFSVAASPTLSSPPYLVPSDQHRPKMRPMNIVEKILCHHAQGLHV